MNLGTAKKRPVPPSASARRSENMGVTKMHSELIERLVKATGPDLDLDHAIAAAVRPADGHGVLLYTGSIDAALTLVPVQAKTIPLTICVAALRAPALPSEEEICNERDVMKAELSRLRIELRDWQDSSEAYRADAERLRAANEKLVEALRRISKGEISGKGVVARAALREREAQ